LREAEFAASKSIRSIRAYTTLKTG